MQKFNAVSNAIRTLGTLAYLGKSAYNAYAGSSSSKPKTKIFRKARTFPGNRKFTRKPADQKSTGQTFNVPGYTQRKKVFSKKPGAFRKFKKARNFQKRVQKAMESTIVTKNNYCTTNAATLSANVGSQTFGDVLIQNSFTDLNNIFSNILSSNQNSSQYGYTGAAGLPSSIATKFEVTSYSANLMFKNQTNVTTYMDLYTVVPRQDIQFSPNSLFSFKDQGSQNGLSNPQNQLGVTPFQSQPFVDNYKILNKVRYTFTPGSTEMIEFHDRKRKTIDMERLNRSGAGTNNYFRGLSKDWFAVAWSEPVNDSVTTTAVSSGPVKLDVIATETYWYTFTPEAYSRMYIARNLGTVNTAQTVLIETGATTTAAQS